MCKHVATATAVGAGLPLQVIASRPARVMNHNETLVAGLPLQVVASRPARVMNHNEVIAR